MTARPSIYGLIKELQIERKKQTTQAEQILWEQLKTKQLDTKLKDFKMQSSKKLLQRCTVSNTIFFECDIQTKLGKFIQKNNILVHNAKRLTQLSEITGIPIVATRHVHDKFGDIEPAI